MSRPPDFLSGDFNQAGDLKHAIEQRWNCAAVLLQTVPVTAVLDSERTWDVIVHVFRLEGHAKSSRAYAWAGSLKDGSDDGRIYSALDIGPIKGPADAVGAAIADELRTIRLAVARPKHRAAVVGRSGLFRAPVLARLVN